MSHSAPQSSHSLETLKCELLALDEQISNPPRPMNPALAQRLRTAYSNTLQQIEFLLRRAS